MKAKEYMQQACFLDKRINSLVRQVNNLWDQATNITQVISDMPHNQNHDKSKIENKVVDICDLTDEIRRQTKEVKKLRMEMMVVIEKIPEPEYKLILQEKYFEMMSWEDIASDINRSVRSAQLLHGKA
ncbi:MAG: DUF1492 domain-containing protein, partial [Eubacterium sp.]|nr:DUF1492 domain-containing protein [Eubacterium sp.]